MRTDSALDALEQAVYDRDSDAGLICHSDRGSQYLSSRYTERLAAAGIEASVGSRGDAYDNALAESVIGLFTTEVIRQVGRTVQPERARRIRTLSMAENITRTAAMPVIAIVRDEVPSIGPPRRKMMPMNSSSPDRRCARS